MRIHLFSVESYIRDLQKCKKKKKKASLLTNFFLVLKKVFFIKCVNYVNKECIFIVKMN